MQPGYSIVGQNEEEHGKKKKKGLPNGSRRKERRRCSGDFCEKMQQSKNGGSARRCLLRLPSPKRTLRSTTTKQPLFQGYAEATTSLSNEVVPKTYKRRQQVRWGNGELLAGQEHNNLQTAPKSARCKRTFAPAPTWLSHPI